MCSLIQCVIQATVAFTVLLGYIRLKRFRNCVLLWYDPFMVLPLGSKLHKEGNIPRTHGWQENTIQKTKLNRARRFPSSSSSHYFIITPGLYFCYVECWKIKTKLFHSPKPNVPSRTRPHERSDRRLLNTVFECWSFEFSLRSFVLRS